MDGQATRETFLIIRDNPIGGTTLTLEDVSNECCVNLEVFAELTPSSDFYNDQNAFLFFGVRAFQLPIFTCSIIPGVHGLTLKI